MSGGQVMPKSRTRVSLMLDSDKKHVAKPILCGGTKKCIRCMGAYGSQWKHRGAYGGVWNGEKSVWNWYKRCM